MNNNSSHLLTVVFISLYVRIMKSLSNIRNEESKEEQIAVFWFLVAWGTGTHEIPGCISAVYVDYCMLLTSVYKYYSDSTSRF